jgi:hypothetical protein
MTYTYGKSQGIVRPVIRAYKKKARIRRYAITIIQRPIVQGVSLITNSHPTTTANAMRIVVLSPGIRSLPYGLSVLRSPLFPIFFQNGLIRGSRSFSEKTREIRIKEDDETSRLSGEDKDVAWLASSGRTLR